MNKIFLSAGLVLFLLLLALQAEAEAVRPVILENAGIPHVEMLFDGDLEGGQVCPANASLTVRNETGIGALYLIFDREYSVVTLTNEWGEEVFVPTQGILHKLVNVEKCFGKKPRELTVCFSDGQAAINELFFFPESAVPDWVQSWELLPQADLMLFSTHGDDEQLFFAGLLPWYGVQQGKRVQVVYFTDHRNLNPSRVHEMLNGLWNVGIRYYPVFGPFADYYTFDMRDAYRFYESVGQPEETLLEFVVAQLRRFRPQVAVGHDIDGEYGHGMHKLYTDLLCKALEVTADPEAFPELAAKYGTWEVPKTYLHLYRENPVEMDWDIPMEAFDGKTAYEVTRDLGFSAHASQQKDFAWYFRGAERAVDVEKYSPCSYGLYRTAVGPDTGKKDFFENLSSEPVAEVMATDSTWPPEPKPDEADRYWILIPAIGTALLAVLTVCLSKTMDSEKNKKS